LELAQDITAACRVSADHKFWTALGIATGSAIHFVPPSKASPPSVMADVENNEIAKRFVEVGLGKLVNHKKYTW
jgi:hypothetical protein